MHKDWNNEKYGWVRFNEYIRKSDASSEIGKTFLNYNYKPKEGWLTVPFTHHLDAHLNDDMSKSNFNIINNGGEVIANVDTFKSVGSSSTRTQLGTFCMDADHFQRIAGRNEERYYRSIDISQYTGRYGKLTSGGVQPSAHIGVYPVPRLTTTTGLVPYEFTNVEILWDIDTEMEVEFGFHMSRTTFNAYHYDFDNRISTIDTTHLTVFRARIASI